MTKRLTKKQKAEAAQAAQKLEAQKKMEAESQRMNAMAAVATAYRERFFYLRDNVQRRALIQTLHRQREEIDEMLRALEHE